MILLKAKERSGKRVWIQTLGADSGLAAVMLMMVLLLVLLV